MLFQSRGASIRDWGAVQIFVEHHLHLHHTRHPL